MKVLAPGDMAMRFVALDSCRGVAAILVVLVHLSANGRFYHMPFVRNGGLSVPFFFVLSGFVISHAYRDRLGDRAARIDFLLKRLGRLYPLHLVTLGALVALEIIKLAMVAAGFGSGQAPFTGSNSLTTLAAHLFLLQSVIPFDDYSWNGPSWSISVEYYTYVLFCLAMALSVRTRTGVFIVASLTAALAVSYLERHYDLPQTEYRGFLSCIAGFALGILIHDLRRRWHSLGRSGSLLEILCVVVATIAYVYDPVPFGITLLVFAALIFTLSFEAGWVSRVLKLPFFVFLGRISYSMYMVHFVILSLMNGFLRPLQGILHVKLYRTFGEDTLIDFGPPGTMDAFALAYVVVVILVSICTYRWVELPGQRLACDLITRYGGRRNGAMPVASSGSM